MELEVELGMMAPDTRPICCSAMTSVSWAGRARDTEDDERPTRRQKSSFLVILKPVKSVKTSYLRQLLAGKGHSPASALVARRAVFSWERRLAGQDVTEIDPREVLQILDIVGGHEGLTC
jgi:hypothetical protein